MKLVDIICLAMAIILLVLVIVLPFHMPLFVGMGLIALLIGIYCIRELINIRKAKKGITAKSR